MIRLSKNLTFAQSVSTTSNTSIRKRISDDDDYPRSNNTSIRKRKRVSEDNDDNTSIRKRKRVSEDDDDDNTSIRKRKRISEDNDYPIGNTSIRKRVSNNDSSTIKTRSYSKNSIDSFQNKKSSSPPKTKPSGQFSDDNFLSQLLDKADSSINGMTDWLKNYTLKIVSSLDYIPKMFEEGWYWK